MRNLRLILLIAPLALFSCKKEEKSPDTVNATPESASPESAAATDLPAPPDVAAPPADAEKSASGLAWKVLAEGTGEARPNKWDSVQVHYSGWTTDGKMFDSSVKRGRPATFALKGVIAGWTEGLQLMRQGEKRRFWIPKELAYNDQPGRPAGMLVFDVELLDIQKGPEPLPAPETVAAPPADAKRTASGLAYQVLNQGSGKARPDAWDRVEVHYTGWTQDGEMFDSSRTRNRPATFGVEAVIAGWTEGLQLMKEGDSFRFWIPANLAYGETPSRPGAPAGQLTFDVELLKIIDLPEPPKAPEDVAGPPANAKKTESGLAYRVLKKGNGKEHPKATDQVEVHYSGWTTDGKMFDSSVTRGRPATFYLNRVIKGWTEGVQLMTKGEKTRFWIPGSLAYGDTPQRPGAPAGMLVFDVELLDIKSGVATPEGHSGH